MTIDPTGLYRAVVLLYAGLILSPAVYFAGVWAHDQYVRFYLRDLRGDEA